MSDPIPATFVIDADRLWPGELPWDRELALVDLGTVHDRPDDILLPPCPVIGMGDPAHPLAPLLDTVIERPITLGGVVRNVLAAPRAAAIAVQLLRLLPNMSAEAGLVAESMAYAALHGSEEHLRWRARDRSAAPRAHEGAVSLCREDRKLTVLLDDADHGNAIDRAMRDQLHEAFVLAAMDDSIDTISLRAAGRTFSLGAELSEFGTTTDPATAHAIRQLSLPARVVLRCADRLDVLVQGGCVGAGLELAAWARRLVATPRAWFQLPELAMGIIPGAGGCVSLTRRIGRQRTALMLLSGRRISASQALEWGLVDAIVDDLTGDESGAHVI